MGRPNLHKFDYKWRVGDILKTTRDMDFGDDDILPKGSIVMIYRRLQGYHFLVFKPKRTGDHSRMIKYKTPYAEDFEKIPKEEWIRLLNG